MASIKIVGDAVVITSTMKLEDIRTIKKYRPDALTLRGGKDGKEPIFCIAVCNSGTGNINQYGAEFSRASHDDAKLATITKMVPHSDDTDIKEFVADTYGAYVLNLNKLEATLPSVMEEIATEKEQILANITVVD